MCGLLLLGARALGRAGSVVAAPGPKSTGSIVVGRGLSCSQPVASFWTRG